MPIRTEIWRIDGKPERVQFSSIQAEKRLEEVINSRVELVDPSLMVVGRQVVTAYGKLIDLLALDSEGRVVIVELKRERTPRDVVAQLLDYASWVQSLTYEDVTDIYLEHNPSRRFEQAFAERFGADPPDSLNEEHRAVIVASELDPSTERIVNYLSSGYGVPINVVFLQYFQEANHEYLTRTWLIDPLQAEAQGKVKPGGKEPWDGRDYYVSFGEGPHRSWQDAVKYGFVSAGHGRWYSNTLAMLRPGGRVFVCIPRVGYVGVGEVEEPVVRVSEFRVRVDITARPILELPRVAPGMADDADDPDLSEYVVRVTWLRTLTKEKAIWEKGMFANQNSACKLRNRFTLERLAYHFGLQD